MFKNILYFVFLLVPLLCEASEGEIKHLRFAYAFSSDNRHRLTTERLISGIYTAEAIFEEKHPDYKVDIVPYNFVHHDPVSVIEVAHKICADQIPLVIAGEMSDEALTMASVLDTPECHVVQISPSGTHPKLNLKKPYVFTMSVSDLYVADALSGFITAKFPKDKIGIIHNTSFPYTDYLSKTIEHKLRSSGRSDILVQKILREHFDFEKEIDLFIKNNIRVVVMPTYDMDLKRFSMQAAKRNYFPVYVGSDGWGSNEHIAKITDHNAVYKKQFVAYRNYYWNGGDDSSLLNHFKSHYMKATGEKPDAWSALGFDSAWVALTAMASVSDVHSVDKIRQELSKIKNLLTLNSHDFSFRSDNSPIRDMYIYKVSSGEFKKVITFKAGPA